MADTDGEPEVSANINKPETPPTPETPPVNDPPADTDGLREELTELKGMVSSLAETVAALAPLPGDEQPTPTPWTHKRFN